MNVRVGYDEEEAVREAWLRTQTFTQVVSSVRGDEARVERLARSATFRVELPLHSGGPKLIQFDVRGLADHLPELAERCGWRRKESKRFQPRP